MYEYKYKFHNFFNKRNLLSLHKLLKELKNIIKLESIKCYYILNLKTKISKKLNKR
jgi:hypothetical protein